MANNLRAIRKEKNMTMKELGEKVGVTEAAIGYYETGKRLMNYEMLLMLSEALECSVGDIIEDKKIPASDQGDGQSDELVISDYDKRFLEWFHSLPEGKRKAILISQDAPEDLL